MSLAPISDAGGQPNGVVSVSRDITQRREADDALRASEERYRLAARATTDAIYNYDLVTGDLNWAKGTLLLFGYTDGEVEATETWWLDRIHPDDRERISESLRRFIAGDEERWTEEYRFRRSEGTYAHIFERGFAIRDQEGKSIRMVGAMQDITERRQSEAALQSSEERLRLALSATGLGIWDVDLRTERRNWSDEMLAVLGLPNGTPAIRRTFFERVHREDRSRIKSAFQPAPDAGAPPRTAVFRILRADNGDERWVETSGLTLHDERGAPTRMLGTIQDITSRKQAENALRTGEERLRLALHAGRMFAWERDLSTGWVERSENAQDLIGIGSGPITKFLENILPDDRSRAGAAVRGDAENDKQRSELRYIHPNGTLLWLSARSTLIQEEGKHDRLIGVMFDITERKTAEEELRRSATEDPLTGLANRTIFQKQLAAAVEDAEAAGGSVSLLIIDLDDFKTVNDTLGHDAGDALLKETAGRLLAMVRESDTVARLGGDEFAVLLPAMSLDRAASFAETLVGRLRATFDHDGRALSTKASIGVSAFPDYHREPSELMKDADLALYRAKAEGRSRSVVYTEAAREVMEQRVRDGLYANQFVPFYQPKVCFKTGQVVGFEALARWQHPSRGVLTPGYFGPAFDDPEIAIALGEHMVRQVAEDIRIWLDQGLDCGRIAVNFSSAEFADPHLARHVLDALAAARVPPSRFEVEVTESVFLERGTEIASAILREFSVAGVSVALDDFGTGFASLTHLKRYPVNHIKVDQSFVRDLEHDRDDAAIVAAVIGLGRSLGVEVTAEGVETAEQARHLRHLGCSNAQGYLYGKPMVGSRVPWLLETWVNPFIAPQRAQAGG